MKEADCSFDVTLFKFRTDQEVRCRYLSLADRDADVREGTTKRALRPGAPGFETAPLELCIVLMNEPVIFNRSSEDVK